MIFDVSFIVFMFLYNVRIFYTMPYRMLLNYTSKNILENIIVNLDNIWI